MRHNVNAEQQHAPDAQAEIDLILEKLYEERGLDFRLYRRSTIERRLSQRMVAVRSATHQEYLDVLSRDPAELDRLICHLTLKVTSFFRNPGVFELLRVKALPDLLQQPSIAIWSAGCATGEEPYSMAILVADMVGAAQVKDQVAIVGTDIDVKALDAARAGVFSASTLSEVPRPIIERWFVPKEGAHRLQVAEQLRDAVTFRRHSLIEATAPPDPGSFDLVLCRNVLIYFQRSLQDRVVALLSSSVKRGGFLVLGEAESLPAEIERQYHCLDRRGRVFHKK